jgi:hypothetical protein
VRSFKNDRLANKFLDQQLQAPLQHSTADTHSSFVSVTNTHTQEDETTETHTKQHAQTQAGGMANFASATGSAITATLTPAEIDTLPSTQLQHVTAALREESELLKRFIAAEGWSSGHVYRCSPSSHLAQHSVVCLSIDTWLVRCNSFRNLLVVRCSSFKLCACSRFKAHLSVCSCFYAGIIDAAAVEKATKGLGTDESRLVSMQHTAYLAVEAIALEFG